MQLHNLFYSEFGFTVSQAKRAPVNIYASAREGRCVISRGESLKEMYKCAAEIIFKLASSSMQTLAAIMESHFFDDFY